MKEGFLSNEELKEMGFKSVGEDVLISKKASIYCPELITIGNHVRIDDFCYLVGNITIGNYIHIGAFAGIHATRDSSVTMKDFSGLASQATIFAISDDYTGKKITGGMVDEKYRDIITSDIVLEKFAIAAVDSTMFPGAYLAEGTVLGAKSLLMSKTEPWWTYFGIPCRKLSKREKNSLQLEKEMMKEVGL
jgi:galactoside O-acetyltransferase